MSPTGSWPTGSLTTTRTCILQKTIRPLKLRIVLNSCPTISRLQLQPMTQRKASRRHRKRTLITKNFELCWLDHCTYRSEEQVQNDRKFITLNEKTWCPVHLKIRHLEVQGNLSQEIKKEMGAQFQCQCLQDRRRPWMNSLLPLGIPQNSIVGQQREQISELQFDKFSTPSTFSCWKIRFKNQVTTCSDFHSEAMLGSKKWRWSIQWMN